MNFRRGASTQLRSCLPVELPKNVTNAQLAEKFSRWMTIQGYGPSVQAVYGRTVEQFCNYLGRKPIRRVSLHDIGEFLARLDAERRRSESYLRNIVCTLRCFFDFLCLNGIVAAATPRLFRFRRPIERLPKVLNTSQVRSVLARTRESRDRAILEIIYATGCRAVEIARMRITDINFRRGEIRVCGKRAERIVYFGKPAKRALLRYLENRRDGPVFVDRHPTQRGHLAHVALRWYACWDQYSDKNVPTTQHHYLGGSRGRFALTRTEAQGRFQKFIKTVRLTRPRHQLDAETIIRITRLAGERAGLKSVTPKVLRASFATHMLARGADVHTVQRLLGHSSLSPVVSYLRFSQVQMAKTYRRFHPRGA